MRSLILTILVFMLAGPSCAKPPPKVHEIEVPVYIPMSPPPAPHESGTSYLEELRQQQFLDCIEASQDDLPYNDPLFPCEQ